MNKLTAAKARAQISDVINRAAFGKEITVITRNGKDAAAVIPAKALKLLMDIEDELDVKEGRKSLKESKKKGTTSWEKLKAELKLEK